MALAPLFHSACLLNTRTEDTVASLTFAGASAQSVDEIRRFAERPSAERLGIARSAGLGSGVGSPATRCSRGCEEQLGVAAYR